ncbi:hypothetical protein NQ315_012289 [Exocentrus adspersus]|uniref:Uncharacterized protein n=1 Tax=Exocentrus adspersus TaxID=1586481 RepID=A0AAV8VF83_9CUCU|nr:hypothetical protein NQ315_012289 [Exocentrus adspersus]
MTADTRTLNKYKRKRKGRRLSVTLLLLHQQKIISDADLKILSINPRFLGSTHDAVIWATSQPSITV